MSQAVTTPASSALAELVAVAIELGAQTVAGWSGAEQAVLDTLPTPFPFFVAAVREAIRRGEDPLGEYFCRLLSAEQRRPMGATYTPPVIVDAMVAWGARQLTPDRVIDPGTGSARFLVAAGRRFPDAELIGIELDPVAAVLARGHLAAAGLASRSRVLVHDYRNAPLVRSGGGTLFLGNPPYVRHHLISPRWKTWLVATARRFGLEASQLAGLHAHFFLATAAHARPGDVGALITAAEWLDVNYGRLVRELLTGILGVRTIHVIEPEAMPFPDAATTAVITGFEVGARPASISLGRVADLHELGALTGRTQPVRRERLESAARWTPLTRLAPGKREGFVELGELCRVHRGQVTGSNRVWVTQRNDYELPDAVLYPAVTRARELFAVQSVLTDASLLRRVIDLPANLDQFSQEDRCRVDRFLKYAESVGASSGYIARHRKAWWSVGLREPAPILATYMARRPPAFVRNLADARHINIAHGLYPREPLSEQVLRTLAEYLSRSTRVSEGRTYAGGLTKFEPREMERLMVPSPELLSDHAFIEAMM